MDKNWVTEGLELATKKQLLAELVKRDQTWKTIIVQVWRKEKEPFAFTHTCDNVKQLRELMQFATEYVTEMPLGESEI